jgi:hypothetical protein
MERIPAHPTGRGIGAWRLDQPIDRAPILVFPMFRFAHDDSPVRLSHTLIT